jgi:Ca2+-binding EF-hand superfamily protein
VEFDEFVDMMHRQHMNEVSDEELIEAFKFFDKVSEAPSNTQT